MRNIVIAAGLVTTVLAGIAGVSGQTFAGGDQCGGASWYGPGFHGKTAASGQIFDQNAMTAAHRSLKFGTKVRVTDQRNGNAVVVTINDRGPFHGSRIIDLSKAAATELGFRNRGTTKVCITQV